MGKRGAKKRKTKPATGNRAVDVDFSKLAKRLKAAFGSNRSRETIDAWWKGWPKGVGKTLGGYKLLECVGSGSYGVVFRACSTRNAEQVVALKILEPVSVKTGKSKAKGVATKPVADPKAEEANLRLAGEFDVLYGIHHKNLVTLHHAAISTVNVDGATLAVPWFTMDYIENAKPLHGAVVHRSWDLHKLLSVFADVCDGIQELHRKQLAHQDLKPGNILVDSDGQARVTDFGMASVADLTRQLGVPTRPLGTPGYVAPECRAGSTPSTRNANKIWRADVYSLGVILHELLTGNRPVNDQSDLSNAARFKDQFTDGSWRSLTSIVVRCLKRDPADRYHDAGELCNTLKSLLDSVRQSDRERSTKGLQLEKTVAAYLTKVKDALNYMKLFGLSLRVDPKALVQELWTGYIPLTLKKEGQPDSVSLSFGSVLDEMHQSGDRCIVIRGNAGSGKSTLLKWAAVKAARSAEDRDKLRDNAASPRAELAPQPAGEIPTRWDCRVPFLICLRECTDGRMPTIRQFSTITARTEDTSGWVEEVLNAGRAIVMVDGLDEVPPSHRPSIDDDLHGMLTDYNKRGNAFLVTTRPLSSDPAWISQLGFREARIDPMSPRDQDDLIDRWHDAFGKATGERDAQRSNATSLKKFLRDHPPVGALADSPLLCAMLCALKAIPGDSDFDLPKHHVEIIEELCHAMLSRRDDETPGLKKTLEKEFPACYAKLKYDQRRSVLAEVAHYMITLPKSQVSHEVLTRRATALLPSFGHSADEAPQFTDLVLQRGGLLEKTKAGEIQFVHNTFKEYLAADCFVADGEVDCLANNCLLRTEISNVCVFAAAAKLHKTYVDKLIGAVLPPDDQIAAIASGVQQQKEGRGLGSEPYKRILLGIQMKQVAVRVDPQLINKLQSVRQRMFPPQTMDDAEALAVLQDEAVPYLHPNIQDRELTLSEATACARALRKISTPLAKEAMAEYARTAADPALVGELAMGMNPLEIPHVLKQLTGGAQPDLATELDVRRVSNEIRRQIVDISPLSGLPCLRRVNLSHTAITSLDALLKLPKLRAVNVSFCGKLVSEALVKLARVRTLERVEVADCAGADAPSLTALRKRGLLCPLVMLCGDGAAMEFVPIPAGDFKMGSPESEEGHKGSEEPMHPVRFAQPFFMGRHQVTQKQWQAVMGQNPSHFKDSNDLPVENVSWEDCADFCRRLSARTGVTVRLPSEAEWEYACRAGTTTAFAFGDTLTMDQANFRGTQAPGGGHSVALRGKTVSVDAFEPNKWGLFNVHGNVWEWCEDVWHNDYNGAPADGSAWLDGDENARLLRGGSFFNVGISCRSAVRLRLAPVLRNNGIGFRVVVAAGTL